MAGNGQRVTPQAGAVVKQEIGSTQMQVVLETNVQAAEAEAMVKARCVLARTMPRSIEAVRQRVLKDCERPGFAEAAVYRKPVGKKWNPQTQKEEEQTIDGPSVRFAETVLRHMGNMVVDVTIAEDTAARRRIRVSAMDLETNSTTQADVMIEKTIERKAAKDREVISKRQNSWGDIVYLLVPTEDEMLNKTNAAVSKMRRNKILELAPADVVEEAMERCEATMAKADAADPDAAKRKLIDAFSKVGVGFKDLEEYLGHDLDKVTPKELAELRKVHGALRDGETDWTAVMAARGGPAPTAKGAPAGAPRAPGTPPPAATAPPAEADVDPPHDPKTGELLEDETTARLRAADAAAKAEAAAKAAAPPAEPAAPVQSQPILDLSAPDAAEQIKARMRAVVDDPAGTKKQLLKASELSAGLDSKDQQSEIGRLYVELLKVMGARKQ